jgi:hypothetical protein
LNLFDPDGFEGKSLSRFLAWTLYEKIRETPIPALAQQPPTSSSLQSEASSSSPSSFFLPWPEIQRRKFEFGLSEVVKMFIKNTNRSIFIHWDEVK